MVLMIYSHHTDAGMYTERIFLIYEAKRFRLTFLCVVCEYFPFMLYGIAIALKNKVQINLFSQSYTVTSLYW